MPVTRHPDGSTEYRVPLSLGDLLLDGASIVDKGPVEWRIWPGGWGYVATQVNPHTGASKLQVDGMRRIYTTWGHVEVID